MIKGFLYDWENNILLERQKLDVDFYFQIIRKYDMGSNILELGCGTGRITYPLSLKGMHITGIDISKEMLEVANIKDQTTNSNYIFGDMRFLNYKQEFDVAIVPYNTFMLLSTDHFRKQCLETLCRSLRICGYAFVDISCNFLSKTEGYRCKAEGYCDEVNSYVKLYESTQQNYKRQITTITKTYVLTNHPDIVVKEEWYTLKENEMKWLLKDTGFEIEEIYGTYCGDTLYKGEVYDDRSYKNIYLLKKDS